MDFSFLSKLFGQGGGMPGMAAGGAGIMGGPPPTVAELLAKRGQGGIGGMPSVGMEVLAGKNAAMPAAPAKQGLLAGMGDRFASNLYGVEADQLQPGMRRQAVLDTMLNVGSSLSKGGTVADGVMGARSSARAGQAAAQEAAQRREMMTLADGLGLSPREKLIFLANPEKWAAANATRLEAANVGAGDSRVYGDPNAGGSVYTAPKMVLDGGYGGTQTPEGVEWQDRRGPSHTEENGRWDDEADNDLATRQLNELMRHNRAIEGVQSRRERRMGSSRTVAPVVAPAAAPWERRW
jgi:hypothetical protein